jgi:uncharacterized membrane protein YhhN
MNRSGLPALLILCAVGSLPIVAFMGALGWAYSVPVNPRSVMLTAIVCAAWCTRVVRRRAWLRGDPQSVASPACQ